MYGLSYTFARCVKNTIITLSFFQLLKSNNFRWLNAVKETKIVFFVRDNSGEKILTAHAARRNFSEVICRACAVVVHSWFSHLHGKFCVLALVVFWRCRNKEPHSSGFLCRVVLSGTKTVHIRLPKCSPALVRKNVQEFDYIPTGILISQECDDKAVQKIFAHALYFFQTTWNDANQHQLHTQQIKIDDSNGVLGYTGKLGGIVYPE